MALNNAIVAEQLVPLNSNKSDNARNHWRRINRPFLVQMMKEIISFPMPGHCKILMNKSIVWIWGGTITSTFVVINGRDYPSLFPAFSPASSVFYVPDLIIFPLSMKRTVPFLDEDTQSFFFVMKFCTLGSMQLWDWRIFLIGYTVGDTLKSLMDDMWVLFAVVKLSPPGNKEEVGMGDSGIQHTMYRYKLYRTLCPVNSRFPCLWEQQ